MGLLEQLQEQGWYITQSGLDKLLEGEKNGTAANADVKQVVKLALNTDLKEYGAGALASLASRGSKADSFEGHAVVQLVKLRNLGAPKVNEESKVAPRLLKLTITDGQTQYVALEHEHIPVLSINTPPGTKILLKNGPIRIVQGVMMLGDKNVQVLGGNVTALVEKWELSRTMAKYAKGGRLQFSASGPPPWIPFGQKIQQPVAPTDKDFKSLQPKDKEESTENSAFNALRNDAIAEATKSGTKKTFGGGAKQMVDANVQKIMDKGFTEEQATHALKLTRNNVTRALSNLQRIEDRKQAAQADSATGGGKGDGRTGGRRGFGKRGEIDDSELQAKPSGKVSLFDYFGDILQDSEPAASGKKSSKESTPNEKEQIRARSNSASRPSGNNSRQQQQQQQQSGKNPPASGTGGMVNGSGSSKNYNQRFENNISSSFANRNTGSAGPSSGAGRGGERGSRGGGADQYQGQYAGGQQRDQQHSNNYKQSDYYGGGGSSRYRGGANQNENAGSSSNNNPASTSARSGGNSRGSDSKYNQQHQNSGYNAQQQRQEGYNNNSSNSAAGGGKYNGKGQSSYGAEGRNHQQQSQYGHGQGTSSEPSHRSSGGGKPGGSGTQSGGSNQQQQQQQQQQQSSYGNAPKQSTGYHNQQQQQGSGSSYNSNNTANGHYNQQASNAAGNHGSNYSGGGSSGGGGSNNASKNSKGGRYGGKDESHKYSGVGATQNTSGSSNTSHQPKKGPGKGGHGGQQHPNPAAQSTTATDQQGSGSGGAGSGAGGKQNANANSKVNQVAEQLGSMHVSGGKGASGYQQGSNVGNTIPNPPSAATSSTSASSVNKSGSMKQMNTNNHTHAGPQHRAPQVASPPGVPSPSASAPTPPMGPSGSGPSPGAPPVTPSPVVTGPPGVPKNFIQLPNGYNYNPYQIMGFQNKQTNEFALNVLKSQQQFVDPMQQPTHLASVGPVLARVSPVGPNVMPMGAGPNVTPPGVLAQPQQPPPPPAAVINAGPAVGAVGPHGTLAPTSLTLAPTIAPAPAIPDWKIGDRCMAKYWEDGVLYPAEITDTSKKTFVVHFLEYGNYEEVLKTDCVPIPQTATPTAPAPMAIGYISTPAAAHMAPPHPAVAPVPFTQQPGLPHHHHHSHPHQHHHGHVPAHHPPPPLAAGPGTYQDISHGAPQQQQQPQQQHAHYASFKPGPMAPVANAPIPTPATINQFQPAQHHLHQQQQPQQQQQQQHHHSQQQQQHMQGGHMPQHHHQSQMHVPHGQQRPGGKFREQRPMYVPPAQRK